MTTTTIAWTDMAWNPVRGCSRVSEGCRNCYAEGIAARFSGPGLAYEGLGKFVVLSDGSKDARWTNRVITVPKKLTDPLHWRRPRRIFVNSMSDLFHPQVPFSFIAAVFGVMAMCPQHTFQVLTKRPEVAADFFAWLTDENPVDTLIHHAVHNGIKADQIPRGVLAQSRWPLRNVHVGVSVEDQQTANERVPLLLQLPAHVRWVSYEPALELVNFHAIQIPGAKEGLRFSSLVHAHDERYGSSDNLLDWIVIGGESGAGARPFEVGWVYSLLEQVHDTECTIFPKQLGAKPTLHGVPMLLTDPAGEDPSEWPERLRVRQAPRDGGPAWEAAIAAGCAA